MNFESNCEDPIKNTQSLGTQALLDSSITLLARKELGKEMCSETE
jgi:hypothetical protein